MIYGEMIFNLINFAFQLAGMKTTMYFYFFVIIMLMLNIVACTYYIDTPAEPNIPKNKPKIENCDSTTITYNNYVKNILDTKCNSVYCHGGGAPGNFTGYAGTKASVNNGSFKKRVIDGVPSFMPPGNPLPQQQLDSILIWINQGACE